MNNKKAILSIIACLVMICSFCLAGCGSSDAAAAAPEKHLLEYPDGYDTTSAGASSYDGCCDNAETKYFAINDYYNMESGGSLHILSNFSPYEQSTEYTCGPSSAYMTLNWFGGNTKKYDELTIAEMSGTDSKHGVDAEGLASFFEQIGWYTEKYTETEVGPFDGAENPVLAFEEFCVKNIDNGVPVMVDWIDWDGHWQVVIGIDTCKEDNSSDDVLILADPYDTSDQYQDGYYTFSAERFFSMWHDGACDAKEIPFVQPYVIAMPMDKAKELGYTK